MKNRNSLSYKQALKYTGAGKKQGNKSYAIEARNRAMEAMRKGFQKSKPVTQKPKFSVDKSIVSRLNMVRSESKNDIFDISLGNQKIGEIVTRDQFRRLPTGARKYVLMNLTQSFKTVMDYLESDEVSEYYEYLRNERPNYKQPKDIHSYRSLKILYETGKFNPDSYGDQERLWLLLRDFLSHKVTPEAIKKSIQFHRENEDYIRRGYSSLKNKNKFGSFEEYRDNFYSYMREVMQKSKQMYDSDTVYTALMSSDFEELMEAGDIEESTNKLLETINENLVELQEVVANIEMKGVKINRERFREAPKVDNELKLKLRNNSIDWFEEDIPPEKIFPFKITKRQQAIVSEELTSLGSVKEAIDDYYSEPYINKGEHNAENFIEYINYRKTGRKYRFGSEEYKALTGIADLSVESGRKVNNNINE